MVGSTEWRLTWRAKATPAGRLISRLAASTRHTSETVCIGWPTPDASIAQDGESPEKWLARRETLKASKKNGNGCGTPLAMAAQICGWPSPKASDTNGAGAHGEGGPGLRTTAQLAGYPTPTTRDWRSDRSQKTDEEIYGTKGRPLPRIALEMSGWTTPQAHDSAKPDAKRHGRYGTEHGGKNLNDEAAAVIGTAGNSSDQTRTANTGALNPELPRWLHGFPKEWSLCAPTVSSRSRKK